MALNFASTCAPCRRISERPSSLSLATTWAKAFVAKTEADVASGAINEFVRLEATQSESTAKERSIPLSSYLLAGSIGFLTLAVFVLLFKRK